MNGTVKFFDDKKGFGFIIEETSKREIFVHYSGIIAEGHKTLHDGEKVSFDEEIDENKGKPRAINVKAL